MKPKDAVQKLNEDLMNERTHMAFYVYHASVIKGLHALEYRELFEEAAASEMKHVLAFQDRILGLGGEVGTAAHLFPMTDDVATAVQYAIDMENTVVWNYTRRLDELELLVDDPAARAYLKVFYEDQLQDSYEDCERLRRLALSTKLP